MKILVSFKITMKKYDGISTIFDLWPSPYYILQENCQAQRIRIMHKFRRFIAQPYTQKASQLAYNTKFALDKGQQNSR